MDSDLGPARASRFLSRTTIALVPVCGELLIFRHKSAIRHTQDRIRVEPPCDPNENAATPRRSTLACPLSSRAQPLFPKSNVSFFHLGEVGIHSGNLWVRLARCHRAVFGGTIDFPAAGPQMLFGLLLVAFGGTVTTLLRREARPKATMPLPERTGWPLRQRGKRVKLQSN